MDDCYTTEEWVPDTPDDHQVGRALVLPGGGYTVDHPVLFWTCRVLSELGWRVVTMRWASADLAWSDARDFVERGADVLDEAAGPAPTTIVVAKSLSSCAAPWASRHGYPAVWLTPVMTEQFIADSLRSYPAPSLLVGGTADRLWSTPASSPANQRVLEIEGADHALHRPDSWRASITILQDVLGAVEEFARELA